MTNNSLRAALCIGMIAALSACGGGGGGDSGPPPPPPPPPPPTANPVSGEFTMYGANTKAQPFDRTFLATFASNGTAQFNDGSGSVSASLSYDSATGNCTYSDTNGVDVCVADAQGEVLTLCSSTTDAFPTLVAIRSGTGATLQASTIGELSSVAGAGLVLSSKRCNNTADPNNTVTVFADGSVDQNFLNENGQPVTEHLTKPTVDLLFTTGVQSNDSNHNPFAQVGARAFKQATHYYIVSFGAPTSNQPSTASFPPLVLVGP